MLRKTLVSRHFVAAMLAILTGAALFYARPFPEDQVFLHVIATRAPHAFLSFRCIYNVCLFTTPYIAFLGILSALYVGTLKFRPRIVAGHLPPYPDPSTRDNLFVVVGEVHNPGRLGPSETPHWLEIPERGLFTGIAILGAVGSGKDEDLVSIARGDSEAWRLTPHAWVTSAEEDVNRVRLMIGERMLVGALVMGDQTWSRPLQRLIVHQADITPIRPALLSDSATALAELANFYIQWEQTQV